jgi:hypothetical protein
MLIDFIILDNGAVINLVNNKIKLELGSFVKANSLGTTIKCST